MSFEIRCECGQPIRVEDDSVGQKYKCPLCGREVQVPDPTNAPQSSASSAGGVQQLVAILANLTAQVEKLSARVDRIEKKLESKAD